MPAAVFSSRDFIYKFIKPDGNGAAAFVPDGEIRMKAEAGGYAEFPRKPVKNGYDFTGGI
ncbi:MAG: hypothetical protein LBP79_04215 [Clostridiales bacterium]|jgi:hypothetical protein|nr:hypothetical protein [Clostridiales bacterium]